MIKAYFENNAINVKAFARTHNISYDILHRIIKAKLQVKEILRVVQKRYLKSS